MTKAKRVVTVKQDAGATVRRAETGKGAGTHGATRLQDMIGRAGFIRRKRGLCRLSTQEKTAQGRMGGDVQHLVWVARCVLAIFRPNVL
ncbi:MAG: hypothetical protein EpisKO_09160 [Epibacterium sp.]